MKFARWFKLPIILLVAFSPEVQSQSLPVQKIIDLVSLDSLSSYVRVLSGETVFQWGDSTSRIANRTDTLGRNLTRIYLRQKLESLNLPVQIDTFTHEVWATDASVLAEQRGSVYPELKVLIGAHFDAIRSGGVSPGADDNASGCAAVLEAARLFTRYTIPVTVVYAFWDQEETGRQGSSHYARNARSRGDSIMAVLNIDMIGWDSTNDQRGELWVRNFGQSRSLADSVMAFTGRHTTGINLVRIDSALLGSDHVSFWLKGYSALSLTEDFYGLDRSPYYHTLNDTFNHFNLTFFLGMTRIAVASLAWMAEKTEPLSATAIQNTQPYRFALGQNYPNPFNPATIIHYQLPMDNYVTLKVYDILGREVAVLVNEKKEAGAHEVTFDAPNIPSGVYFYRLTAEHYTASRRMLLLK